MQSKEGNQMAVEKSYARLGLFIVIVLTVVVATGVLFIQRMRSHAVLAMVTYTTENVSGLDVSSPVRYRGVPVGRVSDVRVDPRALLVEIDFEVFLDRLSNIGMNERQIRTISQSGFVFPHMRAQIIPNPVSGQAYVLLDSPETPPPALELGFKPNRAYVPYMPSTIETMEARLPALLDRANATLRTLEEIVSKIPDSLDRTDRFFANMDHIVRESHLPELSTETRNFYATTTAQMEQMKSELDGVIGNDGTLVKFSEEARTAIKDSDLPATTKSAREASETSRLAADDLRRSLPAIQDSLEQMSELARQLQEQPESMVWGPRQEQVKHK
jgi:ABC-type transporter Mla subunit MlaD